MPFRRLFQTGVVTPTSYNFELDVDSDISNRNELMMELTKEALKASRDEARQLAEVLDMKIKGVESIRKDRWDKKPDNKGVFYNAICLNADIPRASDNIGAKVIEESVSLKVMWILEETDSNGD